MSSDTVSSHSRLNNLGNENEDNKCSMETIKLVCLVFMLHAQKYRLKPSDLENI